MDQPISAKTISRRQHIRLIVVAAAIAGLGLTAWAINRLVSPGIRLADVVVAQVRRGDIANTINASGVVIPVHEELVSSPTQTRVAKVHAKPGQKVAAGELLLELDDRTIVLASDSLKEQLAQQENRILGLTLEMDQKRKQLASNIELLELDLNSAQAKLERFQKLRASGAVSGEDMLTAELNVQRKQIELRQQKELIDDNRRATLSNIEGARLQKSILQKQLEQQQQLLAQTRVRAPFAGMLTTLVTDEGASLAAGQQVAKVSELNNYRVEASVSDFHTRSLSAGQIARVELTAQVLAARVLTILPEIQNGMIKLLLVLDEPNHALLRDKLRVDVSILTEQRTATLVADTGPALNDRGRQNVYVIKDGMAVKTILDVGAGDGKKVEIVSGAREGEQLIVSDMTRFKHLERIRVRQ